MTRALLILLCAIALPAQDEASKDLVYVVRIGEAEIGREKVKLSSDGWTSEGSFDLLGTRKGSYRLTMKRHGQDFDAELESTTGDQKLSAVAELKDGTYTVHVPGTERRKSFKVKGQGGIFLFEDMVWISYLEIARQLAAHDHAKTLEPGLKISGVTFSSATEFEIDHLATTVSERLVRGKSRVIKRSKLRLPPEVDLALSWTPEGKFLKLEVESQNLVVDVEGDDGLPSTEKKRTSIVDSGPWRADLSPPNFDTSVEKGVMAAMPDGVKLVCDIYRPKGEGKFPTILARTPYNRMTEGALQGPYYAKRGYVFVAQDVRGRFESEGTWFPFTSESKDGSGTLDWIAKQPWSDGNVGMLGASYVGLVQWLAAKTGNKHLKCIVPQVSPPDPHENFPYEGGAFTMGAVWWSHVLESMEEGRSITGSTDWKKVFSTLPLSALDAALGLKKKSFLATWLEHSPSDVKFWESSSYQGAFGTMTVPALHITGWYDGDLPGAIMNFPGMRQRAKTKESREGQFLIVGPWTHFFNSSRRIGELDFGDEAVVDLDARILRFFDRYLKGIKNGIDREDPVHVFTMGCNRWSSEKDWPIPTTQWTKLFLSSGGQAKTREGDGRLSLEIVETPVISETYTYDPKDLPESSIDFDDLSGAGATADKSKDKDRADTLEYTTPPLESPCELLGPASVVLWASTDAADTDFTASIFRVTPAGKRFEIRGGVQRLRFAKDPTADNPVSPGQITKLTIDCWAIGIRIEAGDRLQVEISSWCWPGYARNLNTLEPALTATDVKIAKNTIYHGPKHPSHLLLPFVPRKDAPVLRFKK